ncbi:MAG: Hdr-like menaquinol oxidoreductase cytochrome c subunit [Gammaproteobacteria bacterium]|nr:Hdr-like menaquinol oxidoreductase cytochrome c subunit [Gammaproteobacteria bacterium]
MRKFWLFFVLAVVSTAVSGFVFAGQENALLSGGAVSKWKGDACVEATPVMRREHMDFLLKQRDETMRQGIRNGPYSLKGCIECHAQEDEQGQEIPVNASGQFCQECHQYVAVSIDCFQCHVATSEPRK